MRYNVCLSEIAEIKNGKKKDKLVKGKYLLFGANGFIGYSNEANLPANSIVLGRVGANCGSVHYVERDTWMSDNTIGVIPNENTDSYFLFYLLKLASLNKLAAGSAQPLINQSILNSIMFNIPEIHQQKRIGEILRTLDKKIKLNLEIIYNLEQLSQTLFKHWFIDFEFPNEEGKPYKSSGGKMVDCELGEIPEGWEIVTIGDVCNANKSNLSKQDNWESINYLDTGSITRNSIQDIQYLNLTEHKIPSRAKRKIQDNDIVYSTVRPNQEHHGIIKKPLENMVVSTGFTVLTSKGIYPNDLIYLWITQDEVSKNLQAVAEQSTSAYPSIKSDDILAIKILMSPIQKLNELNSLIEKHNNLTWELHHENKKLAELRDSLLPKLLSGEVEVSDESVVGGFV